MRVLHLTTEFPPVIYGGLGTALGGLAVASARAGIETAVLLAGETLRGGYEHPISSEHDGDCVRSVMRYKGVTIFSVPSHLPIEAGVEVVRRWKPDVLHLHVFWLWPAARAIRERTGVPIVYHVHSLDRAEYELGDGPPECLTQWPVQEETIGAADRIIALTLSEKVLLAEYCPMANDRVRVVGNGIDDSVAARRAARRGGRAGPALVLYTGRFVERKGVRELLAAIPAVLEHAPEVRFVLAGGHRHCTGADMERWWLPPQLKDYRDRIHFTGWLTPEQLVDWYAAADILAVPSWYEPFGMVILEGMLYGLPIVAADVGGPAEILADGRTGLLVPPKDVEALAAGIFRLVTDDDLRRRLGSAAAEDVRHRWLWPRIVRKMRAVYGEVSRYTSRASSV